MKAFVFEEHASVLPHWAAAGVRNATMVVLDAHLDLQPLDPACIDRLRLCPDADALRALESPHPFAVSADACYGIEDFLYPAARLGLVGRIVWVAPPHVLRHGFGPALERLVQMEGVSADDIGSFDVVPGGWAEGQLLGIPLAVATIEQLRAMALPEGWQLDVDVDYFVELPGDRLWADPADTAARLRALPGAPQAMTLSLSVGSGFTPHHLRTLGPRLAAAWTGETAAIDTPGRVPDMTVEIAAMYSRRLPLDIRQLRQWQQTLADAQSPVPLPLRGPAWVMLGLLYDAAGRAAEARLADAQAAALGHAHPELALAIAGTLVSRGDFRAAEGFAARASDHPATRVRACAVQSRLASLRGDMAGARRWCEAETLATPANPEAFERLAAASAAAGDAEAAATAGQCARALLDGLAAAAQRLLPLVEAASATGRAALR